MRIRKIEFTNHEVFGTLSIDLVDRETNNPIDTIIIAGENGTGKTKLLDELFEIGNVNEHRYKHGQVRFDIEITEKESDSLREVYKDYQGTFPQPVNRITITKDYAIMDTLKGVSLELYFRDGSWEKTPSPWMINAEGFYSILRAQYSAAEVVYSTNNITTVTSLDMDSPIVGNVKSDNNLATTIKQLLIDISNNDNADLMDWVTEHPGMAPPDSVKGIRARRFKNAFGTMFGDNFNLKNIATIEGQKIVTFEKNGREIWLENLSSGEMQIVIRGAFFLKDMMSVRGCLVLIDEPELSLHPRWQKKILEFYRQLFRDEEGNQVSQIFVVTHSPFVLHNDYRHDDKVIVLERDVTNSVAMLDKPEFWKCDGTQAVKAAFKIADFTRSNTPTVYVEGQTDELYLKRARELFRKDSLKLYRIKQVGEPGERGSKNSGQGELDALWRAATKSARQSFSGIKMVLLYDSDTKKASVDEGDKHIRCMENDSTSKIKKGIENLLCFDESFDLESFYQTTERDNGDGGTVTTTSLKKAVLCDHVLNLDESEQRKILEKLDIELKKIEEAFGFFTSQ